MKTEQLHCMSFCLFYHKRLTRLSRGFSTCFYRLMSTVSVFLCHSGYEHFFDDGLIQVPTCKEKKRLAICISQKAMHEPASLLNKENIYFIYEWKQNFVKIKLLVTSLILHFTCNNAFRAVRGKEDRKLGGFLVIKTLHKAQHQAGNKKHTTSVLTAYQKEIIFGTLQWL